MKRPIWRRRWVRVLVVLALLVGGWRVLRPHLRPSPPPPDAATLERARGVRILRDTWGVPHIFGHTDADAAFGLAYAHAEDDWPMIQGVLAAARGRLSLLMLSKQALANDYYVALIHVAEETERQYALLGADTRAVLEGYAGGLNYYAYRHPGEADGRLLPIRGQDIAAGFVHKLPALIGFTDALSGIVAHPPGAVGDALPAGTASGGSNAHAVHRARSSDDVTRLNVNSHQPWEGPVTWYEAHVHSDEGWDMTGGTFPGAPAILHGHNQHLGWAHTVNTPDLVDVYKLTTRENGGHLEYQLDGAWRPFEVSQAHIAIDTGFFTWTADREVLRSVHGPVMKTDRGVFAVRYAGADRGAFAAEQWYRMNKARSWEEWQEAMAIQGVPMFNTVYADRDRIAYVYNATLPRRAEGADYKVVLDGTRSDLVWTSTLPYAELPRVVDPPSGFVQNCNSTPFQTTTGDGNPRPEAFSATAGIEAKVTNRAMRSLALLGGSEPISREAFLAMKWDRGYAPESNMMTRLVRPLLATFQPATEAERQALELLRGWNGVADEASPAAAIAVAAFRYIAEDQEEPPERKTQDPAVALRRALELLHGRVDVPLGDVQRLRRGATDLPIGGGADVLNAVYTHDRKGKLVGFQGDSYVLEVEFTDHGPVSSSIHQYGDSNRPRSPHYADQAPLFVRHQLKPTLRTEAEIRAHLEREYHPAD